MCLISTLLNEKRQDMWNKNEFIVINALPHCFKSSPLVHLPLRWWAEKRRPLPSNYTQKKKVQNDFHYSKYFQLKEKTKENQIVIYKGFIELSLPNQPVNKHTGGFTCCTELKEWEESVFTWVWGSPYIVASPLWLWLPQTWGWQCCWYQRSFHLASS